MSEIETPPAEVIIPLTAPQRLEIVVRDEREPAPPTNHQLTPAGIAESPCVDMRDWFAGQALSGYIVKGGGNSVEHITTMSYRFADAMVRARDRSPA